MELKWTNYQIIQIWRFFKRNSLNKHTWCCERILLLWSREERVYSSILLRDRNRWTKFNDRIYITAQWRLVNCVDVYCRIIATSKLIYSELNISAFTAWSSSDSVHNCPPLLYNIERIEVLVRTGIGYICVFNSGKNFLIIYHCHKRMKLLQMLLKIEIILIDLNNYLS